MTPEKLLAAVDTITEVTNVFSSYPEDRAKAVEAQLFLTMANNYLIELAHHVSKGVEPYDAVMKTLHGELPISDSQQTLLKIFSSQGK